LSYLLRAAVIYLFARYFYLLKIDWRRVCKLGGTLLSDSF
jgi:hypothetical protein